MDEGAVAAALDASIPDIGTIPLQLSEEMKVEQPITPFLLAHLENDAKKIADGMSHMLGGLEANLHAMTAVSLKHVEAYQLAVDNIGASVDDSIDAMSSLLVKCDEINDAMRPVEQLMVQIKSVKRALDQLESAFNS